MDFNQETVFQQGTLVYKRLFASKLDEALLMMEEAFWKQENICRAIGLPNDFSAIKEMHQFLLQIARDGLSIIVVDTNNNKVIGAAFNKYLVKNPTRTESVKLSFKEKRSQAIIAFLEEIDEYCDLFRLCNIDCMTEIMCVGVLNEYRRQGIAKTLCEISIKLSEQLAFGGKLRKSLQNEILDLPATPKIVASLFTAQATQKIGKSLGFEVASERRMDEFEFEGRRYSDVVGKDVTSIMLEYQRLI